MLVMQHDPPNAENDADREAGARATPFGKQIADALRHLNDLPALQVHPLSVQLRPLPGAAASPRGSALQARLLAAIEHVRPGADTPTESRARMRYQILQMRYVQEKTTREIAATLGVAESQYHRLHGATLEAIISLLAAELEPAPPSPVAAPPAPTSSQPNPTAVLDGDIPLVLTAAPNAGEEAQPAASVTASAPQVLAEEPPLLDAPAPPTPPPAQNRSDGVSVSNAEEAPAGTRRRLFVQSWRRWMWTAGVAAAMLAMAAIGAPFANFTFANQPPAPLVMEITPIEARVGDKMTVR
ncbi:MAG: hypothetical protein NTZ05_00015, partial [Chloroflexi bacterium]|nr:hypothetical protein [Chloroflexota bacterium]